AGRRRFRIDRIHHQDGDRESGRVRVGRRHRDSPRQSSRASGAARSNRALARSIRLPLLHDVPRLAEPFAVDARRSRRGYRPQPHRRSRRSQALDEGRARSDALDFVAHAFTSLRGSRQAGPPRHRCRWASVLSSSASHPVTLANRSAFGLRASARQGGLSMGSLFASTMLQPSDDAVATALAAFGFGVMAFTLVLTVLIVAALWTVFSKAGQPG